MKPFFLLALKKFFPCTKNIRLKFCKPIVELGGIYWAHHDVPAFLDLPVNTSHIVKNLAFDHLPLHAL